MARRRSSSSFEDLVDIAAMLPWWLALILAAISYLFIHQYAVMDIPTAAGIGKMGDMVGKQLIKTLAVFGQYIVPFAFALGALVSVIGRRKRANLHETVAQQPAANALNGMNWREFEMLVGESFRRQGYSVTETGGSADGGVDIVLTKEGETYLVQCKQWKAFKVGVNIVRELYGVMAAQGAAGGFVVTSGVFTDDARLFASGRNIELIDGPQLHRIIRGAKYQRYESPNLHTVITTQSTPSPSANPESTSPSCPKCGNPMLLRTARKGQSTGQSFWGCSRFPACRGVRPA